MQDGLSGEENQAAVGEDDRMGGGTAGSWDEMME